MSLLLPPPAIRPRHQTRVLAVKDITNQKIHIMRKITMKPTIKISANVWAKYTTIERQFILSECQRHGIPFCKEVIREARKQLPGFQSIYGYGRVSMPDGKTYMYSGTDTKKFNQIKS